MEVVSGAAPPETLASSSSGAAKEATRGRRWEVDTSAPFESVREAVERFGRRAPWKPQLGPVILPPEKQSKLELLEKVDEAVADIETSRKALEEALEREEAVDRAKLAIEEAFRRWRSEHGQKRRSVINSTKFKNYSSTPHRRGSQMLDVNGLSLVTGGSRSMVGPTLSIGQILSRKLMAPEIFETHVAEGIKGKPKVSLGQILSKKLDFLSPSRIDDGTTRKNFSARRKMFGFAVFSLLLVKQNKNKKKKKNQAWNPQLSYIVKHK